jgi:hypothetical protein
MNEEALKNIWELFTEKGLVSADFETWVSNLSGSTEVQANVHEYLTDKGYVEKDLETWTNNLGLKKKILPILLFQRTLRYLLPRRFRKKLALRVLCLPFKI